MTIVRKAKIKDISIIAESAVELLKYHARFDSYFAPVKNAKDIYTQYFKRCIYNSKKQLLVAECDGKFAGYALIEITSRPPVLKIKNMGVVNDIFVVEEFRKKGIGKELFTGMLDWIKNKKANYESLDYIELSVNIKDAVSQKAWAKYGFNEYMSKQRMEI